ncbi:hypothetical protein [Archaeal virus sp.]|nr:hypothetical protein [Archaeal virus sp.]
MGKIDHILFIIILQLDLLTTFIGIHYFNCFEVNPLPFHIALLLRFLIYYIAYFLGFAKYINLNYAIIVIGNIINFFIAFDTIRLLVFIWGFIIIWRLLWITRLKVLKKSWTDG